MRVSGTIGQNQFEAQILVRRLPAGLGGKALSPGQVLRLSHREVDLDGVDRGYGGDGAAAQIDESPHLEQGLSGDAVDGGDEAGKLQIDFRRFYGSLGGLDQSLGG